MSPSRYNESRRVDTILKDVLDNMGCRERFDEAKAMELWIELAGASINSVTSNVFVRKGVLYVELTSSVWRQELHFNRKRWCEKLNQALAKPMIREIVFR